ncbi:MAG: J domain-containing protein [Ardenticatenaceae bacterium]
MKEPNTTSIPIADPYAILGVARRADEKAIKRAYFKKVRQFPPEKAPEQFKEIRGAYDQLRNAERRAQVDLFLLQPPPTTPNRRRPSYDLNVHKEDIIRLALELAVGQLSIEADFHEPNIPK